jgi:hypothetical protein
LPKERALNETAKSGSQCWNVIGRVDDESGGGVNEARSPDLVRYDDGKAGCHRFGDDESECILMGRKDQEVDRSHEIRYFGLITEEMSSLVDAEPPSIVGIRTTGQGACESEMKRRCLLEGFQYGINVLDRAPEVSGE